MNSELDVALVDSRRHRLALGYMKTDKAARFAFGAAAAPEGGKAWVAPGRIHFHRTPAARRTFCSRTALRDAAPESVLWAVNGRT